MKGVPIAIVYGMLLLYQVLCLAQDTPSLKKPLFKTGEQLDYTVRYGFLKGGEASVKVVSNSQDFNGRKAMHFEATGSSSGTFDIFFKVRNRYESYVDPVSFRPIEYLENIRENNYRRVTEVKFDFLNHVAVAPKGPFKITGNTIDIVSAFYFARSLNLTSIKPGDKFTIEYFLEDGVYPLQVTYMGKERVSIGLGKFNCLKFSPSIHPGRIFRKDSKLFLWVTDDDNRIPLKAKADILVGSVTMELKGFSNLKTPLKTY